MDETRHDSELCNCEHVSHLTGESHGYLAAAAGQARAQHVGPICDECANGHLSEYVMSA